MSYTSKDLNYPNEFHFKKIIGPTNLIFEKASNLDDADYRSICWIKNKSIILNALEKKLRLKLLSFLVTLKLTNFLKVNVSS